VKEEISCMREKRKQERKKKKGEKEKKGKKGKELRVGIYGARGFK